MRRVAAIVALLLLLFSLPVLAQQTLEVGINRDDSALYDTDGRETVLDPEIYENIGVWFPFNTGQGTNYWGQTFGGDLDGYGYGHNPTWTNLFGGSIFLATNQWVSVPDHASLDITQAISLTVWGRDPTEVTVTNWTTFG
ncbi:unnamed protein product, partial [marine sediment metagenome]